MRGGRPARPVLVLGGGVSGLVATAHLAAVQPRPVVLLEEAPEPGGAAGSFAVDGERYPLSYHHVMEADLPFRRLLADIGVPCELRRVPVGVLRRGRFSPMGGALDLLRHDLLPLRARLGMGAAAAAALTVNQPRRINHLTCGQWFGRFLGQAGFRAALAPLLRSKFRRHWESVSAEWLVRRLQFREERGRFGFPAGGMDALISALVRRCQRLGAALHTGARVSGVDIAGGRVAAVTVRGVDGRAGGRFEPAAVLSTLPAPLLARLLRGAPAHLERALKSCRLVGCINGVLGFDRRLGAQYSTALLGQERLSMAAFDLGALLPPTPGRGSVLYMSAYSTPDEHDRWGADDATLRQRFLADAEAIYPGCRGSLRWSRVHRIPHAKPVYHAGYRETRPPMETSVAGLYLAGLGLYPRLRNIGYTVALARRAAAALACGLRGA